MCEYCIEDNLIQMLEADEDILGLMGKGCIGAVAQEVPLAQLAASNQLERCPPETLMARLLESCLWPAIADTTDDARRTISELPSLAPVLKQTQNDLPADLKDLSTREAAAAGEPWREVPSENVLTWARAVLDGVQPAWYQPFGEMYGTVDDQEETGLSDAELARVPQILMALILLARFEPSSSLIERFLFAQPMRSTGFDGLELWLQRRAFYYAMMAYGVNFPITYLRTCDALNRPDHRGFGRPALVCYGLTRSAISPAQAIDLLETLAPYQRLSDSPAFYRHSIDEWLQNRCAA